MIRGSQIRDKESATTASIRAKSSGRALRLVSDAEFDAAFARIRAQGLQYYADPRRAKRGEINHLHGGRGVYFDDPNGHVNRRRPQQRRESTVMRTRTMW